MKTAVLLVNLGTPDKANVWNVAKYLTQFLNDERVIDIHPIARFFLVNFIIIPFRVLNSTKLYQKLWSDKGSPLLFHLKECAQKLQQILGENEYKVFYAMRYGNPSLEDILKDVQKENARKLIIVPMYPQYASSSSGSCIQKILEEIKNWQAFPEIIIKGQFYDNHDYIDAVIDSMRGKNIADYDHVLFSYHGLPERQLDKTYVSSSLCAENNCEKEVTDQNYFCYKSACYETTRLLSQKLQLKSDQFSIAFQSRIGKGWITPYSDKVVAELAQNGMKKLLVFSPSFVADCLETTVEVGQEFAEIFKEHGGERLDLVESLNSNDSWVATLHKIVLEYK